MALTTHDNPNAKPSVRIPGKAIGIIGIPDTVNEARIRTLVSSSLSLEKVEMRPENEGAILVFENEMVIRLQSSSLTLRMQEKPPWRLEVPRCWDLCCAR